MSVPQTKVSAIQVRTCLWFASEGEQAAEFYVSLLANSFVESTFKPETNSPALTIDFTLGGTPYQILNGGPQFKLTAAASISVLTEDQAETDQLWSALTANGGSDGQCGWVTDKFGVSWQIVPKALPELIRSDDQAAAKRTMDALMTMQKIDITALKAAFLGD